MRENCTSGSVRGAPGNRRPYRGGLKMNWHKIYVLLLEKALPSLLKLSGPSVIAIALYWEGELAKVVGIVPHQWLVPLLALLLALCIALARV